MQLITYSIIWDNGQQQEGQKRHKLNHKAGNYNYSQFHNFTDEGSDGENQDDSQSMLLSELAIGPCSHKKRANKVPRWETDNPGK